MYLFGYMIIGGTKYETENVMFTTVTDGFTWFILFDINFYFLFQLELFGFVADFESHLTFPLNTREVYFYIANKFFSLNNRR